MCNWRMTAEPIASGGAVELPASEARSRMPELLDAVADGQFVYLTRRGKRIVAIVPADIARDYEQIEDDYWARRAKEARQLLASGEDEVISFDELVAQAEGGEGLA